MIIQDTTKTDKYGTAAHLILKIIQVQILKSIIKQQPEQKMHQLPK